MGESRHRGKIATIPTTSGSMNTGGTGGGGGGMVIGGMQGEGGEIRFLGEQNKTKIYKSKKYRKIIRLMTVMGYVFSVSLAAIVLSLYYVFLWDPDMKTPNQTATASLPCTATQNERTTSDLNLTPATASTPAAASSNSKDASAEYVNSSDDWTTNGTSGSSEVYA